MKTTKQLLRLLFVTFLLTGCLSENENITSSVSGTQGTVTSSDGTAVSTTENKASATDGYDEIHEPGTDDNFSKYTFSNTCDIVFSAEGATVTNVPDSVTLTSNTNGDVVLTSKTGKNMNYRISGSGSGSLKIYSEHLYEVELAGVTLTSDEGPAINLQSKKRVFVVADEGTTNTFADGTAYASSTEDQKGTIFSEGQMVFCGAGTIKVTGNTKHAVCTDQYMVMEDGTLTILSAVSDGIHVDSRFIMQGGTLNVNSTGDGVQAEGGNIAINGGTVNISTTGEKSHGFTAERYFRATGGTATVSVSGNGSKDIKSDANVVFTGGSFTLTTSGTSLYESADLTNPACVKADSCIYITGATLTCKSTGKGAKGINADNDLKIDGGTVSVTTTGGEYKYNSSLSSSAKGICSEANVMFNGGVINVSTLTSDGDEGVESKNTLIMNGGELVVNAYDDAINASKAIYFEGGKTYAYSTHNDGVDSNGSLAIGGGVIIALSAAGSPEEGMDCDNTSIVLTGGTLVTMGGAQGTAPSAPTSSTATQCTALLSGISLTKGQYFSVNAADGTNLMTFKIPFSFSGDYTLITSPNFVQGTTYKVTTGTTEPTDATETWNGLYLGSSCMGSSTLSSFTFSSTYYGTMSSTGGGMSGGFH
jgi:hypothetical protein